ncbi:uncharacterized protein LOC112351263 [Selaginella moellendorffii]|uniref:uncharacterized protein LOC112342455 n=1 Tax=Selaginella moellendorffii TaxID=88036 RepID=UPI000D1CE38F|nr:uncharacterized protein LOC112342455 [Selaginella moellendorffii]XP_024544551.1 uncharacterized protein LOC112351263 [Selaginella moellendorffii]|eukprot:XP_024520068.1 uncharacterized protein LOC112342455 [Selaginella moellendorffii]
MAALGCFRAVCLLHAAIDCVSGCLMIFFLWELAEFGHGKTTSSKILGSTPYDQLLIATSESLVGMLLLVIGLLLFMVSFVKDRDFQTFFAKGCIVIHGLMVVWRLAFEIRVEELAGDSIRQMIGDCLLGSSWIFFLIWNWREKYD